MTTPPTVTPGGKPYPWLQSMHVTIWCGVLSLACVGGHIFLVLSGKPTSDALIGLAGVAIGALARGLERSPVNGPSAPTSPPLP